MAALIEQSRYIMADVAANNNKFWYAELYEDGTVVTRWGRVGDDGQSKSFPSAGLHFFEAKCREKRNKGYKPLRTLDAGLGGQGCALSRMELESVAQEQIAAADSEAALLVARLTRANVHKILASATLEYDSSQGTFSTPLGIVTQDTLDEARRLLTQIGDLVNAAQYDDPQFASTVSDYLMLIPQNIGRGRLDLRLLYPDLQAVQTQNGILDALEVSLQNVLSAPKDIAPKPAEKVFDVKIRRVETGREIDRIRRKYRQTQQNMHLCAHLDVKAVYEVEVATMRQAFEEKGQGVGNVWELWHGTKVANLLSILKSGLRIAPPRSAHITGKMFGNGLYFSDQSTKSLNYAYGYWDGQREENCFMLLCDVAMGRSYTPRSWQESLPAPGFDSVFAKAGVSGVQNNEMIVYQDCQVNVQRLVEFSPDGK